MDNYSDFLNSAFQALADPARGSVVQHLAETPVGVKTLALSFDKSLPPFMQHLLVLEDSGLIASDKAGSLRICRLTPRRIENAESWLSDQRAVWEQQTDRLAMYVEHVSVKEES